MNLSFSCSSAVRRFSAAARFVALSGVLLLGASRAAHAESIGINFNGINISTDTAANNLAAGTSAGVVAQTNWNNLGGISGTSDPLNNNLGVTTTTTLTYSAPGGGRLTDPPFRDPAPGDEQLNNGDIAGTTASPITLRLNNVTYRNYDVYIYNNGEIGAQQRTTLGTFGAPGSISYYGTSPDGLGAGYVDSNPSTPYIYTQATSTSPGAFTPNANYVRFTGLSGASQSFSLTGLNGNGFNSFVGGIQVVNTTVATPEPSTWAMMGLGLGALAFVGRRRKRDSGEATPDLAAVAI